MKKSIWLLIMVLTVSFSGIRPAFAETRHYGFRCGKTFVTFPAKEKNSNLIITLRKSDIQSVKFYPLDTETAVVETKRPSEEYQYYVLVGLKNLPLLIECLD